jgi:hypothetical protein
VTNDPIAGSASTIATIDCAGSVSAIDLVELPDFLKAKDEPSLGKDVTLIFY